MLFLWCRVLPDGMPRYAVFHQGFHCLLRQNRSSEKKFDMIFLIITCDPTILIMDHPDFTVSTLRETP